MSSVNKVMLMGNMTRDPELRYTPRGTSLCEFGMAMNRTYTTKGGDEKEEATFVDVTFWSRRAEVVAEYFSKGDPIFVEGRLKLDQWETSDGRRSKLTVVGEQFAFCGQTSGGGKGQGGGESKDQFRPENHPARKKKQQDGGGGSESGQRQSSSQGVSQQSSSQQAQPQGQQQDDIPEGEGFDVNDDEIPF